MFKKLWTSAARMTSLLIKFCLIFSALNCVLSADYGDVNSTLEFKRRRIRSPAFIENSQNFQGSVIFNTYFSSCASSCSENDTECLGRCSNQNHGDIHPDSKLRSRKKTGRVVGGKRVNQKELPSVVAVIINGEQECGASIINKHYVLTAAHCVDDGTPASHYKILAGTININQSAHLYLAEYGISHFVIHEKYVGPETGYDIAVLRTIKPIVFIPGIVEPAKLPKPVDDDNCGYATVWGWGRLYDDGPQSNNLLKVNLPFVPYTTCLNNYAKLNLTIYNDLQICYGFKAGEKDACQGDSGGPLTCHQSPHYQIGIVSHGEGCAQADFPGVYTRVSKFHDWIAEKVKIG